MSIGVTNQYFLQFDISNNGDFTDFIETEDLVTFTYIEESGNKIPTFQLDFYTDDEDVFPLLNEGNDLQITFGLSQASAFRANLATMRLQSVPAGQERRLITVIGMLSVVPYVNQTNLLITPIQSGIETILSIAGKTFNLDPGNNITKSLDSQSWIQPNQSDKSFISNVWLHCNLNTSFPILGITSEGNFVLKDLKKDLLNTYKWRFTTEPTDDPRDIYFDGDPFLDSNTGFINNWTGYGKNKLVYDADTAVDTPTQFVPGPIMANTNILAKQSGITAKFDSVGIINSNTDPNYWSSYQQNLGYLAAMSTFSTTLSFHNLYVPIQILDQIYYRDSAVDSQNNQGSSFNAGKFYVSKVARTISNNQLVTVVVIGRESINSIQVS
jgi:hypothetical protein